MTLREQGELVIWLGAVAAALTALGVLLHFTVLRPTRKWLAVQVGQPVQDTATQLETQNGKSVGEYVEESAGLLEQMRDELRTTNQLAVQTNAIALENSRRIDMHLMEDHRKE